MSISRLTALLAVPLVLLALTWVVPPAFAGSDKVMICHIPPGNPDNVRILSVGPSAADDHIAEHGDFAVGVECVEGVGACEDVGVTVCAAGGDVCTATPGSPSLEVCDDLDNDCDGAVDEDGCTCPCFDATALDTLETECRSDRILNTLSCRAQPMPDEETRVRMDCRGAVNYLADVRTDLEQCRIVDFRDGDPFTVMSPLDEAAIDACLTLLRDKQAESGVCDTGP
jgi:hypothetical protein